MRFLPHSLIVALVLGSIVLSPPAPREGYATHYRLGLFEQVRLNRGLPPADCHVSSDWHELGSLVAVEGLRTEVERVCQVSDVSEDEDRERHMRAGLFELDLGSAQDICGKWWQGPWRWCPVVVRAVVSRRVYQVRGVRAE